MALEIKTLAQEKETMANWTANRDLFTNGAGKAVEAGDPTSAFLLVRAGQDLTAEQMKTHEVKKSAPRAKPKGGKK